MTQFLKSLRASKPYEYALTQRLQSYSKAVLNTQSGYANKCAYDIVCASLSNPGESRTVEAKLDYFSLATGNLFFEHDTFNHSTADIWAVAEPFVTLFTREQVHSFLERGSPVTSYEGNTTGVLVPAYIAKQVGVPLWKVLREKQL